MEMKEYSTIPSFPEPEPYHQMQFTDKPRTRIFAKDKFVNVDCNHDYIFNVLIFLKIALSKNCQ